MLSIYGIPVVTPQLGEVTYCCRSQQLGWLVMPLILGHMDLNADKGDGYYY